MLSAHTSPKFAVWYMIMNRYKQPVIVWKECKKPNCNAKLYTRKWDRQNELKAQVTIQIYRKEIL